jgi:membrane-associated phospholipid phosphatase
VNRVLLVLLALLSTTPARAIAEDRLVVDPPVTAARTGGALLVWGASELAKDELTPPSCRWCEPPALDRNVRMHLVWSDQNSADSLSTALLVALPASLAVVDFFAADRNARRAGEDLLVVVEAVSFAGVTTQALKYATARRRPDAWASGVRTGPDSDNSFPSGHASAAFASAAAFGAVAQLRGYGGWPIVYAGGLAVASGVAYLRIAADRHWLTDAVTGAAIGGASGIATPYLLHRRDPRQPGLTVTAVPLGVAGRF